MGDMIDRDAVLAAVHEADSLELAQHGESRIADRIAALPAVKVGVKPDRETFDAMCAMRDSINEYVPMPSLESDLLQGPENSVFCAAVAEAVIKEVTRLRSMVKAERVKRLEWHNFDAWTHWAEGACGSYHVEERNGYWQVELRVGGLVHGVSTTEDTTPEDLDAAKAAAQADYEARILAALEPHPAPDAAAIREAKPRIIPLHTQSLYGVCIGGRWDGWVMVKHPDGYWVSHSKPNPVDPSIPALITEKPHDRA